MKKITKIYLVLLLTFLSQVITAQQIGNLEGINYQAVAIDSEGKEIVGMDIEGKPLYEKTIGVRFTILKDSNGPILYQETHTALTDQYGLFSLVIGQGELTGEGLYSVLMEIPWIDADQFLKVELAIHNDGNYDIVSLEKFMTVPYSFYTDDIADNAITTAKILDETILAEDIGTGSVESSEILDETILAEDIGTGSVGTSEILDETILAEDIGTGSVESSEILDETILAEDIGTGSVGTSEILDETILAEDIGVGSVGTSEILNASVINEDIADGTIDLTTKVTGILPVANGGTGNTGYEAGELLVGGGTNPVISKVLASPDSSISIAQTADSILISAIFNPTEITSDPAGTFNIGNLNPGQTYTSNAINSFEVNMGDIIIGSINVNLQGCMMTCYVSQPNVIRVSIYNGTGTPISFGNVDFNVYVVR